MRLHALKHIEAVWRKKKHLSYNIGAATRVINLRKASDFRYKYFEARVRHRQLLCSVRKLIRARCRALVKIFNWQLS